MKGRGRAPCPRLQFVGVAAHTAVMPGLVPPARPKPLRRGEGPGIHVFPPAWPDVHGRDKPGHDALREQARWPAASDQSAPCPLSSCTASSAFSVSSLSLPVVEELRRSTASTGRECCGWAAL